MKKLTDKLFGSLNMSWRNVVIFAVAIAFYTAAVLVFVRPLSLSFRDIGGTLECWIFFAIIIITNCQKPLESALKTFVFFLISQPLIYLFQVPFYEYGWKIFEYYPFWFIWTLLTFPMAFAGWYLKKRNWIGLLLLAPMFFALANLGLGFMESFIKHPPYHLLSCIFCFAQMILYSFALFDRKIYKILSLAAALLCIIIALVPAMIGDNESTATVVLEDDVTSSAVVTLEDEDFGRMETNFDGEFKTVTIYTAIDREKSTVMTVKDGNKIYQYRVNVFSADGTFGMEIEPME